jgi:hypothetical protein
MQHLRHSADSRRMGGGPEKTVAYFFRSARAPSTSSE